MSRLPSLTARKVVAALKSGGFVEDHQRGSHLYLWHPERETITSVPMHPGDLPRGTLRAIIQQAGFADDEFIDLL